LAIASQASQEKVVRRSLAQRAKAGFTRAIGLENSSCYNDWTDATAM
jgi:hypothetical protein